MLVVVRLCLVLPQDGGENDAVIIGRDGDEALVEGFVVQGGEADDVLWIKFLLWRTGRQTLMPAVIPLRPELMMYGSQAAKLTNRSAAEFSERPSTLANSFTSGVVWFSRPNGNWK